MTNNLYQYIACDYYATGEGRTIMLLITRAHPREEDYATRSQFKDGVFIHGELKKDHTAKVRAAREFSERFGSYFTHGAENLPHDEFFERFGHLLPDFVKKTLNDSEQPGNFYFAQEFHFNFS